MIDSIYVATSGLNGHQKGLKVISNNVANMNSPGFKGSQTQFTDVFLSQGGDASTGQNTTAGGGLDMLQPTINFGAGELRETGRDLDQALDGPGFFIVRNPQGESLYTKNGRFEFNADGRLVLMDNGDEVMGLVGGQALAPIDIGKLRFSDAKATTAVTLSGNLSSTAKSTDPTHVIDNLKVFDAQGTEHTLKLSFKVNATTDEVSGITTDHPGTWDVTVTEGTATLGTGQVKLANSAPDPLADRFNVDLPMAGGLKSTIAIMLGDQTRGDSGGSTSTLVLQKADGNLAGTIAKTSFDDTGTLVVTYSNTLTAKGPQLALAEFVTPEVLDRASGSLFSYQGDDPVRLVAAGSSTKLKGGSLELSNVDLTDQFSTMILVQRGFQASSQVLSTASEMIQSLYDLKGRR